MSIRRMIPSLFFTLFIAFTSLAVTIPPFSIASHDSALKFRRLDGHYYAVITPRTGELLNSVQQDLQVAAQRFGQLLDNFIPDNWPLKRGDSCPRVWKRVSRTLASMMVDKGECNNLARAAVRAAFHDCFNGACDGSLFLAGELSRQENLGLADGVTQLGKLAQRFKVGVADMFQFAGAAAINLCPMGPSMPVFVGRPDSSTPAPEGQLPNVNAPGDALFGQFAARGFSARDLAALIGAHTAARQFFVDRRRDDAPQDTTPGIWDVRYYRETLEGTAPFTFASDSQLANQTEVGPQFRSFVDQQEAWGKAFIPAMIKMSLIGVPGGFDALTDCTDSLPKNSLYPGFIGFD